MNDKISGPKEHPELPDSYSVKISFKGDTTATFEIASHYLSWEKSILEMRTVEDEVVTVRLQEVKYLNWDKRFSKIMDVKSRQVMERRQAEKKPNG